MFGGEAVLKLEMSTPQRGRQSYPDYVIRQKKQLEETEHIVRENLKCSGHRKLRKLITTPSTMVSPSLVLQPSQVKDEEIPSTSLVWSLEGCESFV